MNMNLISSANFIRHSFQQSISLALICLGLLLPMQHIQAQNDGFAIHKVQKGQTLYSIARQYNIPVSELMQINRLTSTTIYINQPLIVPQTEALSRGMDEASATAKKTGKTAITEKRKIIADAQVVGEIDILASEGSSSRTGGRPSSSKTEELLPYVPKSSLPGNTRIEQKKYYTVRSGDDIYSIADTYEVSAEELRSWNGIDKVTVGDIIIVKKWYEDLIPGKEEQAARDVQSAQNNSLSSTEARIIKQAITSENPIITRGENVSMKVSEKFVVIPANKFDKVESGAYVKYELFQFDQYRFYGAHKSLPQGSVVKISLPDNTGHIQVRIVGQLPLNSDAIIGLSPACVDLLKASGNPDEITILHE